MRIFFLAMAIILFSSSANAMDKVCDTPSGKIYNSNPKFSAPDEERGKGIYVQQDGKLEPLRETRAKCLPLPIRYNNFGALKTRSRGPWAGQIDKDSKGHAIFTTAKDGIGAWVEFIDGLKKPQTAFTLMSRYAPPNDCVGSVGVWPDCPYGPNPTEEYARKVARAVALGPHDRLKIDPSHCMGRIALETLLNEIVTFENGAGFCGGRCEVDPDIFNSALDEKYGDVNPGQCADPAEAHEE